VRPNKVHALGGPRSPSEVRGHRKLGLPEQWECQSLVNPSRTLRALPTERRQPRMFSPMASVLMPFTRCNAQGAMNCTLGRWIMRPPSETESGLHSPISIGFDSVRRVRETITEGEARRAEPYIRVRIPSSPPNTVKSPANAGLFVSAVWSLPFCFRSFGPDSGSGMPRRLPTNCDSVGLRCSDCVWIDSGGDVPHMAANGYRPSAPHGKLQ
jgi:hypothetical protein